MIYHLFNQIERVFRPNEEADTNRKEVIFLKKLVQGDGEWSTRITVLGCDLETIAHLLYLPPRRQDKVVDTLAAIPREARTASLHKWRKLLGMLHRINPAVAGLRCMFTRVQHALKIAAGRHVQLTEDVNNELETWRELVRSLASRPTHLRKLEPFAPTWIGTTDASGSGMGGVCRYPEGPYFGWCSSFSLTTQACLVSSSNPMGYVTINDLGLGALLI